MDAAHYHGFGSAMDHHRYRVSPVRNRSHPPIRPRIVVSSSRVPAISTGTTSSRRFTLVDPPPPPPNIVAVVVSLRIVSGSNYVSDSNRARHQIRTKSRILRAKRTRGWMSRRTKRRAPLDDTAVIPQETALHPQRFLYESLLLFR